MQRFADLTLRKISRYFFLAPAVVVSTICHGMDSDTLSRLITKTGPLVLIPYPAVTVDMGQYLERLKQPRDIEQLWIDYVSELARETEAHTDREATIVAIGIHPFVVGTPAGAEALRRVVENFKDQKLVWVTDVQAVLDVAGETQ